MAVTGAAGFIGRAVVERIDRGALGAVKTLRLNDIQSFEHSSATIVTGTYADTDVRDRLVVDGVDILFHLASLPGGASDRDPALGRRVNLDGTIALIDAVAGRRASIVVYTSSIAALEVGTSPVTDLTPLRPVGGYGTHKAMVELYLADMTRRGLVDSRVVRPAGIVARPSEAYGGFATAWMSDLFHAAREQRAIAIPVRADAHIWLQSIDAVANNIIHAALMPTAGLAGHRAWTLPATVVRIDALVDLLSRRSGHAFQVEYGAGPMDHPPLDADNALKLGFLSDGETETLVDVVMSNLERG